MSNSDTPELPTLHHHPEICRLPSPILKHLRRMEEPRKEREEVLGRKRRPQWPVPPMPDEELEASILMGQDFLDSIGLKDPHVMKEFNVVEMGRIMREEYLKTNHRKTREFLRQWSTLRRAQEEEKCFHDAGYAMIFGSNPIWRYHGLMYIIESMLMAFREQMDSVTTRIWRSIIVPINWEVDKYLEHVEAERYNSREELAARLTRLLDSAPPVFPPPRKQIEETSSFFVAIALHPQPLDYYYASSPDSHHQIYHLDAFKRFLVGPPKRSANDWYGKSTGNPEEPANGRRQCLRDVLDQHSKNSASDHQVVSTYIFICQEYPLQVPSYAPGEFLETNASQPHETYSKEQAWKRGDQRNLWEDLQ